MKNAHDRGEYNRVNPETRMQGLVAHGVDSTNANRAESCEKPVDSDLNVPRELRSPHSVCKPVNKND